jgi:uncharacterized RDD family membrane protein YckC
VISSASANVPFAGGTPAGPARRLVAAHIDWFLCLLVPFVAAGLYVSVIWLVIVPLSVVCYFAVFVARGRTPGMRSASIRIVDQRTGRAPSTGKAIVRSLVALLQAAAFFALLTFAFSDTPDAGYSAADRAVFAAASVIVVSALVAHVWMFFDRRRRSLLDRVFRVELER